MILANGTLLNDRYEILEKLGAGGMAVAYCGRDKMLDRFVTIKVLREEFSSDDEFKEKFKFEARSAASLSHPNIVNVYDVGEYNGISYIVMEYIHGDTLKKAIKEKAPFDTISIVNISLQMASAISHAHKNHVVHRDIKPQNILVGSDGIIKVTDFGIARAATGATVETTANAIGSVHYFSPEQARGGYVDEKSDIYSLGITMYEMATGRVPFDGENAVTIALKHLSDDLPDMRQFNPNLSKNVERIIKKATEKRASDRYANVDLMIEDLLKVKTTGDAEPEEEKHDENKIEEENIIPVPSRRRSRMERRNDASDKNSKLRISKDTGDFEPEYVEEEDDKTVRSSYRKNSNKPKSKTVSEKSSIKSSKSKQKPSESKYRKKNNDDYYEEDYDKGQEKKVIIAAVITALIIIGAISFAGFKFLGSSLFATGEPVTVPYFVGVNYETAKSTAEDMGIELVEKGKDYSNYEAGVIFAQNVEEGDTIKKGQEVGVKVSLGYAEYKMPSVVGKDENDATNSISEKTGIEPKITYEFSEEVETGKVISQSPSEGTTITAKSTVSLVISKGEEFKKVAVPNLVGQTEDGARKMLESKGLILGNVTKTESEKVAEGKVITQTISAGEEVAKNSVVDIVISTGAPKEEEKPENNEDNNNSSTNNNDNNNTNNNSSNNNNNNNTETDNTENTNTGNNNENTTSDENTGASSTKNFPIYLKNDGQYGDTVHVKVVKTGSDGSTTVVKDSNQSVSSFPQQISITGTGSATIECYIDGNLLWSENVDF
ncbi:hypothetical protein B5E58_06675 [Tyzzerella sp. An114]|uniref:protein kinase domain-containing protein n=1 Tax=Tyzzerella sp. An114 TaxID=1965545 RepID=UPI000B4544EC|nr:protein kinase [Tyzzerella sp. An114]OUQ58859.1 hypothetical protein B5E58_06675 [Tyzzerella sp. An114]